MYLVLQCQQKGVLATLKKREHLHIVSICFEMALNIDQEPASTPPLKGTQQVMIKAPRQEVRLIIGSQSIALRPRSATSE